MKNLMFFVLLNSCFLSLSIAQDKSYKIQCVYKLDYRPDSNEINNVISENMLLLLGDNNSMFKSQNSQIHDSISKIPFTSLDLNNTYEFLRTNATKFRYRITKDYLNNDIAYQDFIDLELYEYHEAKNKFVWQIFEDTAVINGFHCQKAVTSYGGRLWTAWFTVDVPVSDGPYKFCGLPGLIIKISDVRASYTFELITLVNVAVKVLAANKSITTVTKEKYFTSLNYFIDNQYELSAARGLKIISGHSAVRSRMKENSAKNNNPIELSRVDY